MIGVLHHRASHPGKDRVLLLMLPGAGIAASEFFENGIVAAVHAQGDSIDLAIDIAALRPALELYLDGEIVQALHRAVIEPAWRQGYTRIWLLGISLGGMGALRYAGAHADRVEGVILLAPFLGTRGTIAEVAKAGGLNAWSGAASIATDQERMMLTWLRDVLRRGARSPALYLGYGCQDRFAPGHRLLADLLPADRVVTVAGGHEWDSWLRLLRLLLDRSPFSGDGT